MKSNPYCPLDVHWEVRCIHVPMGIQLVTTCKNLHLKRAIVFPGRIESSCWAFLAQTPRDCNYTTVIQTSHLYSVFHVIVLQEQGCCELVLGLIVSPKASMWPKDGAEFSFRSEILSNWVNNVAGRWSATRKKLRSGDFSSIYRVSKNGFRLHSSIPFTIWLQFWPWRLS